MITKKQRKASRFYNKVLRLEAKQHFGMKSGRRRIKFKDYAKRPPMLRNAMKIPPLQVANIRETKTQKQNILSFIPKSAKAILGLFKRAS